MMSVSEELSRFASGLRIEDVPSHIMRRAKLSILDGIGTALLSSTVDRSRRVARVIGATPATSGPSSSRAWGLDRMIVSPLEATLINGTLIEGLDYSDIHVRAGLHPTCVLLPGLIACAEARGKTTSGAELLTSFIAGCESMVRLGLAAPGRFHSRGIQPTSILGAVGEAIAASRLLGLSQEKTVDAMSIAISTAFGSPLTVRVGAYFGGIDTGRAAETGLLSALLAEEGVSGVAASDRPFEGRFGFLEVYAGREEYNVRQIIEEIGKVWEMEDIFLKRYPASYACTNILDAAIRLKKGQHLRRLDSSIIDEIRFGDSAQNIGLFSEPEAEKRRPTSIYVAKTSHYFLLALAIGYGRVTPDILLRPGQLENRSILELSDKVSYTLEEGGDRWVEVKLRDGTTLREQQNALVPTSDHLVREKFLWNATLVLGAAQAERIAEAVESLEELRDVGRELASLLGDLPAATTKKKEKVKKTPRPRSRRKEVGSGAERAA